MFLSYIGYSTALKYLPASSSFLLDTIFNLLCICICVNECIHVDGAISPWMSRHYIAAYVYIFMYKSVYVYN